MTVLSLGVWVYVLMCRRIRLCAYECGGQGPMSSVYFNSSPSHFLRQETLTESWACRFGLTDWLATHFRDPPGSAGQLWDYMFISKLIPGFFPCMQGIEVRVSCLDGKHIAHWASLQSPFFQDVSENDFSLIFLLFYNFLHLYWGHFHPHLLLSAPSLWH